MQLLYIKEIMTIQNVFSEVLNQFPFKGDRKRKFMKPKIIYPHILFSALKRIYQALSGKEYTMQQIIRFLSPLCVHFCLKSLFS